MSRRPARWAAQAALAAMALGGSLVAAGPASAQNAHFSEIDTWNAPLGATGAGCPSYLAGDYALIQGTGNGVNHDSVDAGGGHHGSTTFEGTVTITLYNPANVDVTSVDPENVVATPTGPADAVWTGHLTQSFGQNSTRQGAVFTVTVSFTGSDSTGQPITLHVSQHMTWTPGSVPFGDSPRTSHDMISC